MSTKKPLSRKELKEIEKNAQVGSNIWPRLIYEIQPMDDVGQLETENDQTGTMAVERVLKKIRDVYGQPPTDVKRIDWKDYGVVFKERPSPYDFPAFEHEQNTTLLDVANNSKGSMIKTGTPGSIPSTDRPAKLDDMKEEIKTKEKTGKTKKKKEKSKEQGKETAKRSKRYSDSKVENCSLKL